MAHMGDEKRTMNFYDQFFEPAKEMKRTEERLTREECEEINLREAQRSKSAVLLHEMTHTRYAMNYEDSYVHWPQL